MTATGPDTVQTAALADPVRARRAKPSLKRRAVQSSSWKLAGYGVSELLRLGSHLVLARLLFPEAFGLVAIIGVLKQGLNMFSDFGLKPAVIRDPDGARPRFVRTAWTLQVARGLVIYLGCLLMAWPMALVFDAPALVYLIPVAALSAVLAGFKSMSPALYTRRLAAGKPVVLMLISQVVATVVVVGWALVWPSVWALIVGGLASSACTLALSYYWLHGPRLRLQIDRKYLGSIFHFSKWIFFASIIGFIAAKFDRAYIGAVMDMGTLGVYHIAAMLALAPAQAADRIPLMPILSRAFHEQPERIGHIYARLRLARDTIFLTGYGALVMLGPWIVQLLLDERYHDAGWMLQLLAVKGAIICMVKPSSACLTASGRPIYGTIARALTLIAVCGGLPLGWYLAGLTGVIWAIALVDLPAAVLCFTALHYHRYGKALAELTGIAFFGVGVALGWMAIAAAGAILAGN